MSENSKETQDRNKNRVKPDKRADILQGSFEHYYRMAMDHHTKAATTSNLLLIIVGAFIALVGHDNKLNEGIDVIGGVGIFIIGLFGAVWVLKQHERYVFWQMIATKYQENLASIVPGLKTGAEYAAEYATPEVNKEFGWISEKKWDRRLWIIFHSIVAFIGVCIAVYAAWELYSYAPQ